MLIRKMSYMGIALTMMLVGCGEDSSDSPNTTGELANKSLTISGDAIGQNTMSLSDYRKVIANVQIVNDDPDFSLGTAYLIKSNTIASLDFASVQLIIPIKNVGNETHCTIYSSNVSLLNSSDTALISMGLILAGNYKITEVANSYTKNCLGPQEEGYLIAINNYNTAATDGTASIYEDTVGIRISQYTSLTSAPGAGKFIDPPAVLAPQSYTVTAASFNNEDISVTVKNLGSGAINIFGATYILLDSEDKPIYFNFLDTEQTQTITLQPGATVNLIDSINFYGSSNKMRVTFDNIGNPV